MTNDKVNEVLTKLATHYDEGLIGCERFDANDKRPGDLEARRHANWMVREALSWGPERIEKKMRWLGFIQAIVWFVDGVSIDELKADNRAPPKKVILACEHCGDNYSPDEGGGEGPLCLQCKADPTGRGHGIKEDCFVIVQPVGNCCGDGLHAYDATREDGKGIPLAAACSGCRACK